MVPQLTPATPVGERSASAMPPLADANFVLDGPSFSMIDGGAEWQAAGGLMLNTRLAGFAGASLAVLFAVGCGDGATVSPSPDAAAQDTGAMLDTTAPPDNAPPVDAPPPQDAQDAAAPTDNGVAPDVTSVPDVVDVAVTPDVLPPVDMPMAADIPVSVDIPVTPDVPVAVDMPVVAPDTGPGVPALRRGGIGTLGVRPTPPGTVRVVDEGFEFAGGRTCTGTVCVTGGFVR